MAFTLQAFIGDTEDLKRSAPAGARVIALSQRKALVPLTKSVRERHGISFLPLTDEGLDIVPHSVEVLATRAKQIAYVESEFFGGQGTQAAAIWKEGSLVFGPVIADDAINQALRLLGVSKEDRIDEFDALDLNRHRDTEKWT
jgi:hypothetical protein